MAQGRGSAALALCLLLCVVGYVHAATFTVGDTSGWTFNMAAWPKGKKFKARDVIVFNYDSTIHNVVAVDRAGYSNCRTPGGAKMFRSGKDQIKLKKGANYFICNVAGHCESGMKIAVAAA